ncbi:MAG: regulatory protein RecX [Candidatus Omnitrophica bacterium]|nr:regulatory protein RecX [Candidatus Omnitrophota bacterium]
MEDSPYQKAFDHALKLLAIRKRTVRQLEHRLEEKSFDSSVIREVVARLKENKLLDDSDFAREFVTEKMSRGSAGRLKLTAALRQKGISESIVKKTVAELDPEAEYQAALNLALHKAESLGGMERVRKQKKIYDYLARKGYRFSLCRDIVRKIQ